MLLTLVKPDVCRWNPDQYPDKPLNHTAAKARVAEEEAGLGGAWEAPTGHAWALFADGGSETT